MLLLAFEDNRADQTAVCKATIRSLFGSHSNTKSGNKALPTASSTTLLVSHYHQHLVAAVTAGCFLGADICISLTNRWIGWTLELLELIKQLFRSPLLVILLPACFSTLPLSLTPPLHVCICTPLKLTCLHRLTALHGERELERVKDSQADR